MLAGTRKLWDEQNRHPGDRTALFKAFDAEFEPGRVLYPGSWIDIAASFVFADVVYVDLDRRARQFFSDPDGVRQLVDQGKTYAESPQFTFHAMDYTETIPEEPGSFGLLISLYAGLVSEACLKYLKPGGYLLANNSHADAGMASLDLRLALAGVILKGAGSYRASTRNLDRYLKPKSGEPVTRGALRQAGRGVAYARPADAYVFRMAAADG